MNMILFISWFNRENFHVFYFQKIRKQKKLDE